MPPNEKPALPASGNHAGIRYAEQLSFARKSPETQALRRLHRLQLRVRIHDFCPCVLFERIEELDRHHDLDNDLDLCLTHNAPLDPARLAVVGGDRFAPSPIRVVGDRR